MNISHIPSNIIIAANRYMVLLSKMKLDMKRSQQQVSAFISQATQAAASSFGMTGPMSTVLSGPVAADDLIHMVESIEEGKDSP